LHAKGSEQSDTSCPDKKHQGKSSNAAQAIKRNMAQQYTQSLLAISTKTMFAKIKTEKNRIDIQPSQITFQGILP